jgi:hypothetical protein
MANRSNRKCHRHTRDIHAFYANVMDAANHPVVLTEQEPGRRGATEIAKPIDINELAKNRRHFRESSRRAAAIVPTASAGRGTAEHGK